MGKLGSNNLLSTRRFHDSLHCKRLMSLQSGGGMAPIVPSSMSLWRSHHHAARIKNALSCVSAWFLEFPPEEHATILTVAV